MTRDALKRLSDLVDAGQGDEPAMAADELGGDVDLDDDRETWNSRCCISLLAAMEKGRSPRWEAASDLRWS